MVRPIWRVVDHAILAGLLLTVSWLAVIGIVLVSRLDEFSWHGFGFGLV